MYIRALLTFIIVFLSASRLPAQDLRDPRFVEKAQAVFVHMFNLDYDKAREGFVLLEKEYPNHPAPPLYLASSYWLEEMLQRQDLVLNRFVSPAYFNEKTKQSMPAKEREAFFQGVRESEALSNKILKKNSSDKNARYFLETAHAFRAAFAITVDHSSAEGFKAGNKAYSYARQLIKEDPKYYDAFLTAGTYEYIAGNIPWYLKPLATILGIHGNKQDGLDYLKTASEKGEYVKTEAEVVLMVLHVREHQYAKALEIARSLNRRFPRNFLFAINLAQILQLAGEKDQAAAALVEVQKRAEAGEPNFNKIPLPLFRFNLGVEFMNMGKHDLAFERFQKCIENPQTPLREKALSHLALAKILYWKDKRDEAAEKCRIVLSLQDTDDSHDQAKELLKKLNSQK